MIFTACEADSNCGAGEVCASGNCQPEGKYNHHATSISFSRKIAIIQHLSSVGCCLLTESTEVI